MVIGLANIIPGVSGGTMMVSMGIYDRLILLLTHFVKKFKEAMKQMCIRDSLKAMMLDAQKKAYGDGLDPEYMHPYMWACKGHYYSEALSYYNFPYAFGAMLAMGLYSMYLKEGEAFLPKYNKFLHATTVMLSLIHI